MPSPLSPVDAASFFGSWPLVPYFSGTSPAVIPGALLDRATLLGARRETTSGFNVSGRSFKIWIDAVGPITVTFTGTNPLDLDDVVSQINSGVLGTYGQDVAFRDNGFLRLKSATLGGTSYLKIDTDPASSPADVFFELGLFAGLESVGGQLASSPTVDPDRQSAIPGQFSVSYGEDLDYTAINRAICQLAVNADHAYGQFRRGMAKTTIEDLAITSDEVQLAGEHVYCGKVTAGTAQDDTAVVLNTSDNEVVIERAVDLNTALALDFWYDPDTQRQYVDATAGTPFVAGDDSGDFYVVVTTGGSFGALEQMKIIEFVSTTRVVVMNVVEADGTEVEVGTQASPVSITDGIRRRIDTERLYITDFLDGPGGTSVIDTAVEIVAATTISRIEKNNRVVCDSATFSASGVKEGDVAVIASHDTSVPFSNNGSYRVSRVLDEKTVELMSLEHGPTVLNTLGSLGTVTIQTDTNFFYEPYAKLNFAPPSGTYRVVFKKYSSLLDMVNDIDAFAASPTRFVQESSTDLQKAVKAIIGPSATTFTDQLYSDKRLSLENLYFRFNQEHNADGRHSIVHDELHVQSASNPHIWLDNESEGYSALSRTMGGLQLSSNGTNPTNKYTPAIKFMSTDADFTTENPKFLAAIVGRDTEGYYADTDGGMAIDFAVTPDNPGATSVPTLAMTLEPAALRPYTDEQIDLGLSNVRWGNIWGNRAWLGDLNPTSGDQSLYVYESAESTTGSQTSSLFRTKNETSTGYEKRNVYGYFDADANDAGTSALFINYLSFLEKTGNGTLTTWRGYESRGTVAGGTVSNMLHYHCGDAAGAGTITNQYGLFVEGLTSAANNYGLYIANANPGHAIYVAGGDTYLNGNVGINTAVSAATALEVRRESSTSLTQYVVEAYHNMTAASAGAMTTGSFYHRLTHATGTMIDTRGVFSRLEKSGAGDMSNYRGFWSYATTADAGDITNFIHYTTDGIYNHTGTIGNMYGLNVATPGGTGDITTLYGIRIADQNRGTVANYGLYIAGASGGSGSNYAIWVDSGLSRFDDEVQINGGTTGDRLLRFGTDRAWVFTQNLDDAGTELWLKQDGAGSSGKYFRVVSDSGNDAFSVRPHDTASSQYALLCADGGLVGIGEPVPLTLLHMRGVDPVLTIQDTDTSLTTADARIRFAESDLSGNPENNWEIGAWDSGDSPNYSFHITENSNTATPRFTVARSTGNVGIGQSNPSSKLHIESGAPVVTINATSSSGFLLFQEAGVNRWSLEQDAINKLHLSWVGTRKVTFDGTGSSGNVGINTESPEYKLHVVGTGTAGGIFVQDQAQNGAPIIKVRGARNDANTNPNFAGRLVLEKWRSDARVGTGIVLGEITFGGNHTTASSSNILHTAAIQAVAENAWTSSAIMDTGLAFRTGTTGDDITAVGQVGSERMRIAHDGYVGINTTSPIRYLDVVGPDGVDAASLTVGGDDIAFFRNNGNTTDYCGVYIIAGAQAGSVLGFGDVNSIGVGRIIYNHSNDRMDFQTADAARMYILNNGRVGIGQSSPDQLLDVNGSVRCLANAVNLGFEGFSAGTHIFNLMRTDANDTRLGAYGSIRFICGSTTGVTSGSEEMRLTPSGLWIANGLSVGHSGTPVDNRVSIGATSAYIEYSGSNTLLFVAGSSNELGLDAFQLYPTQDLGLNLGTGSLLFKFTYSETYKSNKFISIPFGWQVHHEVSANFTLSHKPGLGYTTFKNSAGSSEVLIMLRLPATGTVDSITLYLKGATTNSYSYSLISRDIVNSTFAQIAFSSGNVTTGRAAYSVSGGSITNPTYDDGDVLYIRLVNNTTNQDLYFYGGVITLTVDDVTYTK